MFKIIYNMDSEDFEEFYTILSNFGYLLNNTDDESFFDLLDKTMQYVSSLLILSMVTSETNLKSIIQTNLDTFEKKYLISTNLCSNPNIRLILKELAKMIANFEKIYDYSNKKVNCFFDNFRGINWFAKNVLLKPIDELYASYFRIYELLNNYKFKEDDQLEGEIIYRLKTNSRIFFELIEHENKILESVGY